MLRLLGITLLLALTPSCGDGDIGTANAGSGRRAPANFDDAGTDDGSEPDAGGNPDTPDPPDRILREGAIGEVTLVIDGDTVHVTVDGWYHRVRIQGINAPECEMDLVETSDGDEFVCARDDEYWGRMAYESMVQIAEGEIVTVRCDQQAGEACPRDQFDRFLAFLDGESGDLAEQLARAGGAMSFTKFDSTRRATYCAAEDEAIAAEAGMWTLGDRDAVLSRMSSGTRDWYEDRDRLCAEALGE